jgi:hypothetical protein
LGQRDATSSSLGGPPAGVVDLRGAVLPWIEHFNGEVTGGLRGAVLPWIEHFNGRGGRSQRSCPPLDRALQRQESEVSMNEKKCPPTVGAPGEGEEGGR